MNFHLLIVSFIEGITEFLPVSSTAHIILTSKLLGINTADDYIKFYTLFVQMGALLAGIILFSKKLLTDKKTFINICISFVPTAIIGFVLYKLFKFLLEGNMLLMASMLLLGGFILIYLEKYFIKNIVEKEEISKKVAFVIGVAQALAIVPGVSRSGITIIAGMFSGIKKSVIIEYSFLLALPTIGAAVIYDTYKSRDLLYNINSYTELFYGFVLSFVTAFIVLFFLKKYISKISLTFFGWYRIIIAVIIFFVFFVSSAQSFSSQVIPTISILPNNILPSDPIMISISTTTLVTRVLFDNKELKSFNYNNKIISFVGIPFEETKTAHKVKVIFSNGTLLERNINISQREKMTIPLGIPEKLGGNTPKAGKILVSNLAIDNTDINKISLITEPKILWTKSFIAPVADVKITDSYGYNRDTVGQKIVHKGSDFRASTGTKVLAINSGIVRAAKTYSSYGNSIIIDHGMGITSLYMHLSELKVKQGDKVEIGQVIGLSGQTGYATGAHLHLSIKIKGVSIDPVTFLKFFNVL